MAVASIAGSELDEHVQHVSARRRKKFAMRYLVYAVVVMLVLWSVNAIIINDTDWSRISAASIGRSLSQFMSVDLGIVPNLLGPALESVLMATLASLLGVLLSVPVAWLGAMNITPFGKATYLVGRLLMTLSRSVHEIVWALIFVAAVGLGALAGILAMAVRSVGFISKTVAEAIEDVDQGPVEALRAGGANKFEIVLYAILPQVMPVLLGNVIFEWDVNTRKAVI